MHSFLAVTLLCVIAVQAIVLLCTAACIAAARPCQRFCPPATSTGAPANSSRQVKPMVLDVCCFHTQLLPIQVNHVLNPTIYDVTQPRAGCRTLKLTLSLPTSSLACLHCCCSRPAHNAAAAVGITAAPNNLLVACLSLASVSMHGWAEHTAAAPTCCLWSSPLCQKRVCSSQWGCPLAHTVG